MTTIFNKKSFIDTFNQIEEDKVILFSNTPLKISGASKGKNGKFKTNKSMSFQFQNSVFKDPDKINDLLQSTCFAVIICDKNILSDSIKKDMEKENKNE
jgi:hypothetical protein